MFPQELSEGVCRPGASGVGTSPLGSRTGVRAGTWTVITLDVALSPCRLVTVTLTFTVVPAVTETWRYVEPPATVTGSV